MRKSKGICGFGKKLPETNIAGCKAYVTWVNMINRCYSGGDKYKSYFKTEVCEEWKQFEEFRDWFYAQDWEGKELDKDIIGDGLLYSPQTCAMVPKYLNNFLTKTSGKPYGSRVKRDGVWVYITLVRNPLTSERERVGVFNTKEEAYQAWKIRKCAIAQEVAKSVKDERVAEAIRRKFSA